VLVKVPSIKFRVSTFSLSPVASGGKMEGQTWRSKWSLFETFQTCL